jgi:hypothetical protein
VTGVDSVKMVLNRFPKGETISLINQAWLKNAWGSQGQSYDNLQSPPQAVVDELKLFTAQKGLTLYASN